MITITLFSCILLMLFLQHHFSPEWTEWIRSTCCRKKVCAEANFYSIFFVCFFTFYPQISDCRKGKKLNPHSLVQNKWIRLNISTKTVALLPHKVHVSICLNRLKKITHKSTIIYNNVWKQLFHSAFAVIPLLFSYLWFY